MNINKYPDKTSYVSVDPISEFTFRINSYEDLWHLNQIVDALNYQKITPTITIPNLIDAQADRRFNKNESSGLKLVCKFLNNMDANFKIFHPHNSEVVEVLLDNVEIIDNKSFIIKVLNSIHDAGIKNFNNLILMSSDAGGFKPLMKLCDKIKWQGEVASASKSREFKEGKTILTQLIAHNDFRGKDILIIDDICVKGGTFIGLSKLLKERNCGKLYLAVSHLTIEEPNYELWDSFDTVFTTDSKRLTYMAYNNINGNYKPENLKIINLF
jgi:ribose-phosphate pyrophosphokinase